MTCGAGRMRLADYPDQRSISTAIPGAVDGPLASPETLTIRADLLEEARLLRRLGFWKVMTHSHRSKNTTHQCGTLVFGHDPARSVLDPFCRTHDVPNLFVVDASFFPSSAAVNPSLTIIAQALRVADHIKAAEWRLAVAAASIDD